MRPTPTVGEVAERLGISPGDVIERLQTAGVREFEHEGQTIAAAEVWKYCDRLGHRWDVSGELLIVRNRSSAMKELTEEELRKFCAAEVKRKSHQRLADACERSVKEIKERIKAWVVAHGGDDRTCKRYAYVLSLLSMGTHVEWKTEFIRELGEAAAEAISAAAPHKYKLVVELAGPATP